MLGYNQNKNSYQVLSNAIPLPIISEIGKGAYGTVYECVNENGIIVAVKKILYDKHGLRCLNEASIMSSINHPHIASCLKIYFDDTAIYIVSKKAKSDLNKWTRKSKKGHIPDILLLYQWTSAIVSAIACLHSQGVIHCDLKASNILMYNRLDIKVNDFTLSLTRHYNGRKYTHNSCTSTHRPLEVWLHKEWDEKIDIWGLGCTLFEIAYGQPIFPYQDSENDEELKSKFIDCLLDWSQSSLHKGSPVGKPKSNKFMRYNLPDNFYNDEYKVFNDLVLSMLKVNPNERPSIFEIQKHPYFSMDGKGLKKTPFLIYSTEANSISLPKKLKLKIKELVTPDVYDYICELYHRTHGFKVLNGNIVPENLRIASITNIACKLYRHPIPLNHYDLNSNELKTLTLYESKFCEYLSFRLHISPHSMTSNSSSDDNSF
jgi:serine/threonine protein kinase